MIKKNNIKKFNLKNKKLYFKKNKSQLNCNNSNNFKN